jgi:hypothetical protein
VSYGIVIVTEMLLVFKKKSGLLKVAWPTMKMTLANQIGQTNPSPQQFCHYVTYIFLIS